MPDARRHLAVALDSGERGEVLAAARTLGPEVGVLKLGLQAFVANGPDLVRAVVAAGARVFLDLKLHDIPNTVAGAAAAAARTGASILNVHASGGSEMMRTGAAAAREAAAKAGLPNPLVIGVTILTSLDAAAIADIGLRGSPREAALRLAVLTQAAGLDGVVCSPEEIEAIRRECGAGFYLVVPGIRPGGSAAADQKRTARPAEALRAGADLLVVGRPITGALDPVAAARTLVAELSGALPPR